MAEKGLVVPDEVPAPKKLTAAERIRLKLIGGDSKKNDVWVQFSGETYLLVPPKVRQRSRILEAAMRVTQKKDAEGNPTGEVDTDFDAGEMQVRSLCACLRDPETRELIFPSEADREALMESPLTPEFDFLAQKAARIINPKLRDVEKNSGAAPGESSSTASPQS